MPGKASRKRKRRGGRPGEFLTKTGGALVAVCFGMLVVGRIIVTLFFHDMKGKGLTPETLLILIPIWSIGLLGLLLLLIGWIKRQSG